MTATLLPPDLAVLQATPGALPLDGATEIAGVAVPVGHRFVIEDSDREVWVTDGELESSHAQEVMSQLQVAFPTSGLWPMLTDGGAIQGIGPVPVGEDVGWAYDPAGPVPDAEPLLHDLWTAASPHATTILPRTWSGLVTPAQPGDAEQVSPLGHPAVWSHRFGRLVLVPVSRPADVVLTLGPSAYNSRPSPEQLTAVLRSWEDRYGALPLQYSFKTLLVGIRRPPRTEAEVQAALVELFSVCPGLYDDPTLSDADVFDNLSGSREWALWWD